MLDLVIGMLVGMKPAIKVEIEKKISNKEIAPNVIKMFGFFFVLIKSVFSKDTSLKSILIQYLPVLMATLSLVLKDLLDEDEITTNLKDIDFDLLD